MHTETNSVLPATSRPSTHGYRRSAGAILLCAGLLAALPSCAPHGEYTKEHISQAQTRIAQLKSGTEWQMAQQQFLAADLDKALKTIDRSIALNPKVTKSHVLRGRILIEQGRLEAARDALLEAETIDPTYTEAQYYLGIVFERFSQPQEALARYTRAAELDPTNPQYVVAAAEMLMQLSRLDDADSLLQSRKDSFGYNAAVRQTQGHIAILRNDPKKAAEMFDEAFTLAPEDSSILEDLARAQLACGDFANAEFNFERLMEKDDHKDRRDLMSLRARCLTAINRPVEARTLLIEITSDKEGTRDVAAWVELGNVAAILKDKAHLRSAASRVTALAPERLDGYVFRALFQRMDGKPDEALASLDQAIARAGKNTNPLLLKAMFLQDLGRTDDARAALAQAQTLNPGNPNAANLLGALNTATVAVPEDTTH